MLYVSFIHFNTRGRSADPVFVWCAQAIRKELLFVKMIWSKRQLYIRTVSVSIIENIHCVYMLFLRVKYFDFYQLYLYLKRVTLLFTLLVIWPNPNLNVFFFVFSFLKYYVRTQRNVSIMYKLRCNIYHVRRCEDHAAITIFRIISPFPLVSVFYRLRSTRSRQVHV